MDQRPDPLPIPQLVGPVHASVRLPGSKSITNRALVCAALANGTSTLRGVLMADDTEAMLDGVTRLGAIVDATGPEAVTVVGVDGQPMPGPITIDARNSGTTSRFLASVLTLGSGPYTLDGHEQLRTRPFAGLVDALRSLDMPIESEVEGHLPITIEAGTGPAGGVELAGDASSQFASGLMLAAPCFPDGLDLRLIPPVVSQPYLAMTVAVMSAFGAEVDVDADNRRYRIAPTGYRATEYLIEPDASTASYFFAIGALTRGRVEVRGLGSESLQGDMRFVEVLTAMGAQVEQAATVTTVSAPSGLRGVDVDLTHISDTAPTLGVVAAMAEGTTSVTGIGFIRRKESDRIAAMAAELQRVGVEATEDLDGFTVTGGGEPVEAVIDTYDDHRIAMAFTVLGLVRGGVSIADPGCVAKTFPGFFDEVFRLASAADMHTADDSNPVTDAARRVIAIDGPSGSGKSTVAKALALRLGLDYLDTGAMYRAVAFAALRHDIDPGDDNAVAALARAIDLEVGPTGVFVDGVDGTVEIRGPEVTRAVSAVAANRDVRTELQMRQREWAGRHGGGVIEGRDIGTVVFPEARLKVFLTAATNVRAGRRAKEVTDLDYETVAADLARRDAADSTRHHDPLAKADDAVELETSSLSIDEVVSRVVELLPEG